MVKVKGLEKLKKVKKGDKVKVDGKVYEVDAHYVLIDHGHCKEMALEIFDPKTDKDFQLRYFDDNIEESMQLYELKEIVYDEVDIESVEF
jgi:hypothetical protein